MKKRVFCVVLVLCAVLSAVAWAENCNCNNDQCSGLSYNIGYTYTLKAECDDFIILLPSIFKQIDQNVKTYGTNDCVIHIYALGYDYDEISSQLGFESSDLKSIFETMQSMLFERGEEYDLISIKNCPALVRVYLDDGYAYGLRKEAIHPEAEVYITNGKTTLHIEMSATETDILTKYLDGILTHIIVNESKEE